MIDGGHICFPVSAEVLFLPSKVGEILERTATQGFLVSKEEWGLMCIWWERFYVFGVCQRASVRCSAMELVWGRV